MIVGKQSESIIIDESNFSGNENTNIYADRTSVIITRSEFKNGKSNPYVTVLGSSLVMQSSKMMDSKGDTYTGPGSTIVRQLSISKDLKKEGKGLQCIHCTRATIFNNEFSNLNALRGGAIFLDYSENVRLEKN